MVSIKPEIIFEDANLVVLSKPAGLLSQGDASNSESLVDYLRVYFGRNYVGLIHRLDRNTSGIMIVAKRSKAAQRLTEALQNDLVKRKYWAIAEGTLKTPLHLEHRLEKNEKTNEVRIVRSGGKLAVLDAEPKATWVTAGVNLTLIEIKLETGRSHQIRVQLAHEKLPLLGDPKYGHSSSLISRPALHSRWIEFPHPISKEILSFESPLPSDFKKLLPNSERV